MSLYFRNGTNLLFTTNTKQKTHIASANIYDFRWRRTQFA